MKPVRSLRLAAPLLLFLPQLAGAAASQTPHTVSADEAPFAFVRARAADDLGELDVAAAGYAAALADNPGDTMLGLRTFRQAIVAGDMPLAMKTAKALDATGSLPPDGTVVLLADAVMMKDWARANMLADRIDREKLFAFLTPTIRAWLAFGTKSGDPLAALPPANASRLALTYAGEHRALLLIAQGKAADGIAALATLDLAETARAARLRIAVAAGLAARHDRAQGLALLTSGDAPTVRARAILSSGKRLRGVVDTPAAGIAELMVRVAADINREQAGPLAVEFARVAAALAPADSEAWLVTASLLASAGDDKAALAALTNITPDDPFIGAARDMRLTLLGRTGHADQALAEAKAAAAARDATPGDLARLGDLLSDANQHVDAAAAYARALALAGGEKSAGEVAWPLLLQQASALLQSGDWPAAKAAAQRALALAPEEPAILNFLGYSQLERGEDVPAAAAMIAKASALAPQDPSITDSLGWSWYLRGDVGKAIPLLEQAARNAPVESDINEHLGDAYWKAGRKLEARYAWRAALVAAEGDAATRLKSKLDYGETGKP
jgi:Flp pilus assembly protein TadD